MNFADIAKINVNEHTEKKGNLTYLSWAWAVDCLQRLDPDASWSYAEPKVYADTMMVFCTVKAFGRERTAQLPVMDYKNKAIMNPDAMQVNTAMQRCLAKAIALHGLGLYIYAGEDLPEGSEETKTGTKKVTPTAGAWESMSADMQTQLQDIANGVRSEFSRNGALAALKMLREESAHAKLGVDESAALWTRFDSAERSAMTKASEQLKKAA